MSTFLVARQISSPKLKWLRNVESRSTYEVCFTPVIYRDNPSCSHIKIQAYTTRQVNAARGRLSLSARFYERSACSNR